AVPLKVEMQDATISKAAPLVGSAYTNIQVTPNSGYGLPKAISIFDTYSNSTITQAGNYSYDNSTGTISINPSILTTNNNLVLRGSAVPEGINGLTLPVNDISWDNIMFGNYPQDQTDESIKQPIMWRLLNINGEKDTIQLLSDKALDQQPFNSSATANYAWSASTLPDFLNDYSEGKFSFKAFTDKEYNAIRYSDTTEWPAPDNGVTYVAASPWTAVQNGVGGRVSLLSQNDVTNPQRAGMSSVAGRLTYLTEYAKLKGSTFSPTGAPTPAAGNEEKEKSANWWLRSPGGSATTAATVDTAGVVQNTAVASNATTNATIRPTIKFNYSDILFVTAAYEGKPSTVPSNNTPAPVLQLYPGQVKNMTLKINDLSAPVINSAAGSSNVEPDVGVAVTSGASVTVNYSHSQTKARGNNAFLSVALVDGNNELKYYAPIAALPSSNTSVTNQTTQFAVPSETGLRAKFFVEQQNGNYQTDFSNRDKAPIIKIANPNSSWSVPVRFDVKNAKVTNNVPVPGSSITMQIQPNSGYSFPASVTIYNKGAIVDASGNYTYNSSTGALTLNAAMLPSAAPTATNGSTSLVIKAVAPHSGLHALRGPNIDTNWDNIVYGNYPQENSDSAVKQPIIWKVLNTDGDFETIQLQSEKILDHSLLNTTNSYVWANTTNSTEAALQSYLNDYGTSTNFPAMAFSPNEFNGIRTSTAAEWPAPDDYTQPIATAGFAIQTSKASKLGILSYTDSISPSKSGHSKTVNAGRIAYPTDYLRWKPTYSGVPGTAIAGGSYWTRSPGTTGITSTSVSATGAFVRTQAPNLATNVGIRPSMRFNQNDILYVTAAYNGKRNSISTNMTPRAAVDMAPGQLKKLTIKNEKLSPPIINSINGSSSVEPNQPTSVSPSANITVNYSHKQVTGEDRGAKVYLSVALLDDNNSIKYHSPIAELPNDQVDINNKTASFTVPAVSNLKAVFMVEQLNGNYQTDFVNKDKAPTIGSPSVSGSWTVPIRFDLHNVTVPANSAPPVGNTSTIQISPSAGYKIPQNVSVMNNGVIVTPVGNYSYNNGTGELTLQNTLMTNNASLVIKATGLSGGASALNLPISDTSWDNIVYGNFPQEQTDASVKQPINWRLLNTDSQNGTIQLLAEKVIDYSLYNNVIAGGNSFYWSNASGDSAALTYLNQNDNNGFAGRAFSKYEYEGIRTASSGEWPAPDNNTLTPAAANAFTLPQASKATKLALLSYNDVITAAKTGMSTAAATASPARAAYITDFARTKGELYVANGNPGAAPSTAPYWLRSPGAGATTTSMITKTGAVSNAVSDNAAGGQVQGLRPTMKLNLSDIWMVNSAYEGKKNSINSGSLAVLQGVPATSPGQMKKLTIKTSALSAPVIGSITGGSPGVEPNTGINVTADATVNLTYSHPIAKDETLVDIPRPNNTYLSVILTDSADVVKYHGPLASLAEGTAVISGKPASFKVPDEVGLKAYFIVEQLNGNYQTDFVNKEKAPAVSVDTTTGNWSVPTRIDISNGKISNDAPVIGNNYVATIVPETGYIIPKSVIVSNNGGIVDPTSYSYSSNTGELSLPSGLLTNTASLVIKAVAPHTGLNAINIPIGDTSWDNIAFGNYPQEQNDPSVKQPIIWKALNMDQQYGTIQLLSDKILDQSIFSSANSSLWSNGTTDATILGFLNNYNSSNFAGNAFSQGEFDSIRTSKADEWAAPNDSTISPALATVGNQSSTASKIALMSYNAMTSVTRSGISTNSARKAYVTDYSRAKTAMNAFGAPGSLPQSGEYWLRSPGTTAATNGTVRATDGAIIKTKASNTAANVGIRPTLRLNLSEIFMISAAYNGKSNSVLSTGIVKLLGEIAPGQLKKLTVKTDKLEAPTISSVAGSGPIEPNKGVLVNSGDLIPVTYSQTQSSSRGSNVYISVYLVDANNKVRAHGAIAKLPSDNTTVNNKIATFLVPEITGLKAYFAVEELNGNYQTDFINKSKSPAIQGPDVAVGGWTVPLRIDAPNVVAQNVAPKVGQSYSMTLHANKGYALPQTIVIFDNGGIVSPSGNYSYNVETGEISFSAAMLTSTSSLVIQGTAQHIGVANVKMPNIDTNWDNIVFGNFPQEQAEAGTKQPIQWRVMNTDATNQTIQLITDKVVDYSVYNNVAAGLNSFHWSNSTGGVVGDVTALTYLNGTANNQFSGIAFNSAEFDSIRTSTAAEWPVPDKNTFIAGAA
ncbi:MAG: DUF6273 domain-containing protein, partial [Anaerovoracaceae bacterium]